ncbi:Cyclin-dependent kinase G-2 [Vitis vinifera]|uniref:cyclin-dependent kinase n=1 Tax=Vitis vinifera TaxID=29760 RepID=A0A438EY16_VITVI|nr:Cyclin-dependent kinase G-2 [Vitis vinifera]
MAAGRVGVSRRNDFYKYSKKEHDYHRNPNRGVELSRDRDRGVTVRNGFDSLSRVSSDVGGRRNVFRVRIEEVFAYCVDAEKEVRISSKNGVVSMSTVLSQPKLLGEVVSDEVVAVHSDADRIQCLQSSIIESHVVSGSAETAVVEPPACLSSLMPGQRCGRSGEEVEHLEEEVVCSWNIATSRTLLDGKASSPESGEFQREDSEGDRAESSVTDEVGIFIGRAGGEECSGNELDNNDCMEINDGEDETRVDYQSGLDSEDGAYGVVYRARDKKTGEIVALKKMKMKIAETDGFPMSALREINILLSFHHPSIVDVKEVVMDDFGTVYMVMEYMEHDLKRLIELKKRSFSLSEVKGLMLQLLEGVQHLHHNWVLHRDLKTSNLLLNDNGELKICDFGLSRQYASPSKPYTQLVVTLWYRAPELLLGTKQYSTAIDMWSVGCIMAELLAKEPLFQGKTELDQLDKIFKILGTPNKTIWPGVSNLPGFKANFVKQPYNLLRKKFPATSFTGFPVLSDSGFDLLSKLLTYDPEKRITAEAALDHDWFHEVPLPKCEGFMPFFPAQHAQDRHLQRIIDSLHPIEEP